MRISGLILNMQNTVTQYIAMRLIMDLFNRTVRRPGAWVAQRWCEQEGIYLAGARERAATVEDGVEEGGGRRHGR